MKAVDVYNEASKFTNISTNISEACLKLESNVVQMDSFCLGDFKNSFDDGAYNELKKMSQYARELSELKVELERIAGILAAREEAERIKLRLLEEAKHEMRRYE